MNCLNCNNETSNPKFCNASCSAIFNNTSNHWRKQHGIIKNIPQCLNCGDECKKNASKFCSKECHIEYKMLSAISNSTASHKTTKKYLLAKFGNICNICGITEWNNKIIKMELEHINGNSEDNTLDNVCLICPNCHSQTDTYKAKNIGNGRHSRKLRYQEGKSY